MSLLDISLFSISSLKIPQQLANKPEISFQVIYWGMPLIAIADQNLLTILLRKMGWIIATLFLLFLTFQQSLSHWLRLNEILWIDEFIVIMTLSLSFIILLHWGRVNKDGAKVLICLLALGLVGIISGLINDNPFYVTANGVFEYLKNFLVIPVFCLLSIQRKNVTRLYKILYRFALFLCLVAIGQEMAFLAGLRIQEVGLLYLDYRFGLMRTPSLMGHPNIFGLYSLLFFILDFSLHRRIRWQNLLLVSGIFLSLSRMVWTGFLGASVLILIRNRRRRIAGLFIFMVLAIGMAFTFLYLHTTEELVSENYFRGYTLLKSIEIWKRNAIWGVGPGMYGGVTSFIFDSPIYKKYNFSEGWLNYMKGFRSLDQFWAQILAEIGIIGTMIFLVLLFLIWRIPQEASLSKKNLFQKRLLSGLSIVTVPLFIYLFGTGLNITPFLLTFTILLGMSLGAKNENPPQ